jgi:hypothetical protein
MEEAQRDNISPPAPAPGILIFFLLCFALRLGVALSNGIEFWFQNSGVRASPGRLVGVVHGLIMCEGSKVVVGCRERRGRGEVTHNEV